MRTLALTASLLLATASSAARAQSADAVKTLPTAGSAALYPQNRTPLQPSPLIKLPIASFKPSGWLGEFLKLQRDGLTGHLGEISVWLTRKDNAWLSNEGKGAYGWEEVPYWLRGYSRLAYVLDDPQMLEETRLWVEGTLSSQRENGDFGPMISRNGHRDLWAQMLMLQVLQSFYEHTSDPRVLPFMTRYFKWQLAIPDDQFLEDYWENSRGGDNLASVYWLYNRTGDAFLLDLAAKIDHNTADWRQKDNLPNWHVVNIAECFRAPATFFLQSGRQSDIDASVRDFHLVRERYGQVPGGMFGADENARPGHADPHQASETCSFVEQIYSNLVMSTITGDPSWAANTEDVAFNSLPAAFTPDYRALRYLTAPNQVVSDSANHAPGVANEGPFFLMNPFSSRCCQHNHSSAWINYTEHAWMATPDGGLASILFAPGVLAASTSAGQFVITTSTNYPFEEEVRYTITKGEGSFPLSFRVPEWSLGASISLNGKDLGASPSGGYLRVTAAFKQGDTLVLRLPMHLSVRTWSANKNAVSVDYGPLTFSLKIEEQYRQVASDKTAIGDSGWQPGADASAWPSHEILPGSPWNYALVIDPKNPAASITIERREFPASNQPFTSGAVPILLRAKGKRLPNWTLDTSGLAAELPQSPAATLEPLTELTLIPMGAARLRISAFPTTN